jgi:hypothetical protein
MNKKDFKVESVIHISVGDLKSAIEHKSGYLLKRAIIDITISTKLDSYKIKISHESKALSDFFYHRDFNLINKTFIFYFQNKSGVWYNFSTLDEMIQFIGIKFESEIIINYINEVFNHSLIKNDDI